MFVVLAVCLVVWSSIGCAMSSLTVPRSSVVVIVDRVEMKCSVTGRDLTTWKYTSWNTSTETNIYLGKDIVTPMRSRYKIDKNISGQHNLIIDSVDWDHAGRYRCSSAIQKTLWNDIQLTVLGSDPVCAANISPAQNNGEEQMLSIWCSITYMGKANPVFTWTKSNVQHNIGSKTTNSGTSRGPVTNNCSIIPHHLHANDSGVTFQCWIMFQMSNNSQRNATNVYEYTWNYMLYGPRNLSIDRYADHLLCSADGNPTTTYRWTNVETNTSTDGSVFILKDTAVSNKHTFQCTAANVFAAENINITIKGQTQNVSIFPITASATGASILFLLITAIIVYCAVRRKRPKDRALAKTPTFQPRQSSNRRKSPPPTYEVIEVQIAASDNYSALIHLPTADLE